MELISVEIADKEKIRGWVATDKTYKSFSLQKKEEKLEYGHPFNKAEYRDYEHFAAVIGKFNPYTFFLEKPIEIPKMDFNTLTELIKRNKITA